jgi:polysaccharide biosynthesis/export protein
MNSLQAYYDKEKIVLRAVILGICILPALSGVSLAQDRSSGAQTSGAPTSSAPTSSAQTSTAPTSGTAPGQGQREPGKQEGQKQEQQTIETDHPEAPKEAKKATSESAPIARERNTDFQDFVAGSLGYSLPIFGQGLFQNVPSTFAPLDLVPVTPDYVIGPGDQLVIRTWGQLEGNYAVTVDRTGSIGLPKVGNLSVVGLRYDQLHDFLTAALGRAFKNFELSVTLGQLRSIQIFVFGQARRPGVYTISSLSTLINAIFVSGGPSNLGSMRRIQLKRHNQIVTIIDLYDLITNGDKSKDVPLLPGDVIYVPPVGRLAALSGTVNVAAVFELKDHDTLGDVIGYSGGLTTTAATQRAIVERIDAHHVRKTDEIPLTDEGLRRELRDGDVVRFLPISSKFDNAVTLRGNVAGPGRYPWHEGMRVRDLIPSRDFLVTEEYWKQRNLLGLNAAGQSQISRSAGIVWDYAVIDRMDPGDLTSLLLPFNLGKAIEGDEAQNLALQVGDVITIFSQSDMQVPIGQQTKFVHLEGEFQPAGIYRAEPGETLRHLVTRVGLTPQAYLFGAEFTRDSTRADQQRRLDEYIRNLEQTVEREAAAPRIAVSTDDTQAQQQRIEGQRRLLDKLRQLRATGRIVFEKLKPDATSLDELPDLVLENNDRLFVPYRPETVSVIGSVYNSNAFIFEPGQTVSDSMRASGGATRDADQKRAFVIRANGATVSSQQRGLLGGRFNNLRLLPGDTLVVPEKLDKGAILRGFKDWAQILSEFALGAAAAFVFTK